MRSTIRRARTRSRYEGDLVTPRYEDPNGYGAGVPAPGGTILRTNMDGSYVELVAGGMRNPYDIAFNGDGELFTYDADMEWDIGTPWYRPTRVNHVPMGAELGWRSGWAKWPEYYLDSVPATLDVGAGSPTGIESYNHVAFPKKFQNALFVADWALGQIHAVQLTRNWRELLSQHRHDSQRAAAQRDRPRGRSRWGALLLAPVAAGPMAASIASSGRAQSRRTRSTWAKASSRRCGSRNSRAIGPGGRSRSCSVSWAIGGRPNCSA